MNVVVATILVLLQVLLASASRVITNHGLRVKGPNGGSQLAAEIRSELQRVRENGVTWLMSQQTDDFGWPSGDTARVVVALASAREEWPLKSDLVTRLIIKQLEIELLEKLLRKDIDPITPVKLAFFALALGTACKNPRNFFGHNLIASLEKHHGNEDFPGYPEMFGFSLTSLVSCMAGSHLKSKRNQQLFRVIHRAAATPYSLDTQGTALMALECIHHRRRDESLGKNLHEPLQSLADQQHDDGSFGNIHSTAIAIQTLAISGRYNVQWNKTAAALALASAQEDNGSFLNNLYATTESVLAVSALLNGFGLLGVRRRHCHHHNYANSIRYKLPLPLDQSGQLEQHVGALKCNSSLLPYVETLPQEFSSTTDDPNRERLTSLTHWEENLVNLRYWLWIGNEPLSAIKYNLSISVPENTTFYTVMQRAAEVSVNYEFASSMWPNGHYIHTISSHHEEPSDYHYWLLYLIDSDPDPNFPPKPTSVAPAGVDDLKVTNGQVYLFWLKKI